MPAYLVDEPSLQQRADVIGEILSERGPSVTAAELEIHSHEELCGRADCLHIGVADAYPAATPIPERF